MDMTARLSSTYTGDQPRLLRWISSFSRPTSLGTLGPQMSMSNKPTCVDDHQVRRAEALGAVLDNAGMVDDGQGNS